MSARYFSADRPAAEISWLMLERFVFRRDDDDGSFPDEAVAPMRASSVTSLGDPFTVALLPAAPPAFSRLYVQWPRGPRGVNGQGKGTELLNAHGDLLLLCLTSEVSLDGNGTDYRQDYFVFNFNPAAVGVKSRLKRLPAFTEPTVWRTYVTTDHRFNRDTIGVHCGTDDFTVVDLAKFSIKRRAFGAELCVFRSPLSTDVDDDDDDDDKLAKGKWKVLKLPIQHTKEEFTDLAGWSTDATIVSDDCIIWVDYHQRGILSYKPPSALGTRPSSISYSRLPINNNSPRYSLRTGNTLEMYRSLCVAGKHLKFIDVARKDGSLFGPLGDVSSFTMTCHTRVSSEDNVWHQEGVLTSDYLLYLTARRRLLPDNVVPMFPLVDRDEPNLIHFIVSEPRDDVDKLSVVVIDIIKRTIVSISPYIRGEEDLCGKDADMVRLRCRFLRSFLPVSSQACSHLISQVLPHAG